MKLLVCGGRTFGVQQLALFNVPGDIDRAEMQRWIEHRVLDATHASRPVTCLVHGGAHGADMVAGAWARLNNIEQRVYKPDWKTHGKAAGIMRNDEMLNIEKPDMVLAFPGGRGTEHMVSIASDVTHTVRVFIESGWTVRYEDVTIPF